MKKKIGLVQEGAQVGNKKAVPAPTKVTKNKANPIATQVGKSSLKKKLEKAMGVTSLRKPEDDEEDQDDDEEPSGDQPVLNTNDETAPLM